MHEPDWGEIIPRLQIFYKGDPDRWLHMPIKFLGPYIAMHPILQAEEALQDITNIAVGTGSLKKEDIKEIMRELRSQANERTPRQRLSIRRDKAALAAMGIQVVEIKKNGTVSAR